MIVRLVVSGRNYQSARPFPDTIELPEGATVDDALRWLSAEFLDGQAFPPSCLLAVSGKHLGTAGNHPSATLSENDELMIFAPVAGG